jgi:hypothetical protein
VLACTQRSLFLPEHFFHAGDGFGQIRPDFVARNANGAYAYISPDFSINVPGQKGRHTREPYPDWDSDLIYVTDGNGGGLTVLRYTGPLPTKPPIPAVR